ncbi:MAG: AAA family ATPase [bacterium]|nr:AAA family ATPase [bacterium]
MSTTTTSHEPLPTRRAGQLDVAPPDARWLIDQLWAECGVGLVGGTPKSCKSWLGLEMATAVASGTPCLERFDVCNPGPALIYLAEDALPNVRDRLAALCAHRQLDLETLQVHVITAPTLRLDLETDFRRLTATVAQLRPRLLLLDPLVRLHRANENDANHIAAILGRLRALQRKLDVAVVLVHHARKQGSAHQPGQALRGSGDLHAFGDSNLYLVRDRHGLKLVAEHRAAPAPDDIYIRLTDGTPHLVVHRPNTDSPPPLQERVVTLLREANISIPRTALRKQLAVNNKRLGDTLLQLEKLGVVRRTSDGWTA